MPKTLRKTEVAKILGVNPATVDRWAKKGWLSVIVTPSGQRRYRMDDILEYTRSKRLITAPGKVEG